ncbi:lipase family alpha/beta hydrolase [Abyssisolibacter fermentans]|uniref:lipase family alpha/beta hydrolase n=1 Tax=Abyssisolibacter fermentans TaxID=1766203 RepID=UPI000831337A|nr:hypothetical protein [Abyssisolibacter fermentans]
MTSQNPVVFVPGIFGSLGHDIIPGTGKMRFGPSKYVYEPVVENFIDMGYKKEETLFVCFYNWRKSNKYSAKEYLIPIIEKAKNKTGSNKVDIVAHSMGGLVARSYIQSEDYRDDINKLILAGTPNAGSPSSYFFCSGGKLPYDEVNNNFFFKALWEGFVWYMKASSKGNKMGKLKNFFPSVTELLPCRQYGDYIFKDDDKECLEFIPISDMELQNNFLNELNDNSNILYRRRIKIYQIIGYGYETDEYICIKKADEKTWKDGKPVYSVKTVYGDGRVTCDSCKTIKSKQVLVTGSHTDLLKDNKLILANMLNKQVKQTKIKEEKNKKICNVLINGAKRAHIKVNENEIVVDRHYKNVYKNINVEKTGYNNYWVLIYVNEDDKLKIKVDPLSRKCNVSVFSNSNVHKNQNININIYNSGWIDL